MDVSELQEANEILQGRPDVGLRMWIRTKGGKAMTIFDGHTKGPWKYVTNGYWHVVEAPEVFNENKDPKTVADLMCEESGTTHEEAKANGALIEVLPDLLQLCKAQHEELQRVCKNCGWVRGTEECEDAVCNCGALLDKHEKLMEGK